MSQKAAQILGSTYGDELLGFNAEELLKLLQSSFDKDGRYQRKIFENNLKEFAKYERNIF